MYISASHDYTSRITFPNDGANKFGTSKFVFRKSVGHGEYSAYATSQTATAPL